MNLTDEILELEYKKPKGIKTFLYSFMVYFLLILFFTTLSSYQNPRIWISKNSEHLQSLIELQISTLVNTNYADSTNNLNNQINNLVIKFYESRNFETAWIENIEPNNNFHSFFNLLDSAKYYGFPFDYFGKEHIKSLNENLITNKKSTELINTLLNIELATTYSAFKYLIFLNRGIVSNDTTENFTSYIKSLPEFLNNSINWSNVRSEFLSVQPDLVHHHNILNSLEYFIDLHYSIKYTTPAFIDDKLLAKSLFYTGITDTIVFNATNNKSEALYKLQDMYGLRHDSIMNVETHTVLVSLLKDKYYLACLNLNRLRKLNHTGENYLFVNIPEFKLHVVEANQVKEIFNVIVGTTKTPTPTLTSSIEKVIANPYWTVPKSISYGMIPKIRRDSSYLKRNGFFIINNHEEFVDASTIDWSKPDPLGNKYWIRQINSSRNALGQVKFIFPNDYSVYLHDTPSKRLFKNKNRTYSHGCVRLENPDKLAQYISDKFYSNQNIDIQNIISNKERYEINLSEKVNIHIQYITCSGDENANMVFYKDVYDLDQQEIKEVFPEQTEI